MTLMLAGSSICTAGALERHLASPGFECCERELLGRSRRRDWGMRQFRPQRGTQSIDSTILKFMDALFGLVAQNDAEITRLELLGWTWRRDWGMRNSDT